LSGFYYRSSCVTVEKQQKVTNFGYFYFVFVGENGKLKSKFVPARLGGAEGIRTPDLLRGISRFPSSSINGL